MTASINLMPVPVDLRPVRSYIRHFSQTPSSQRIAHHMGSAGHSQSPDLQIHLHKQSTGARRAWERTAQSRSLQSGDTVEGETAGEEEGPHRLPDLHGEQKDKWREEARRIGQHD